MTIRVGLVGTGYAAKARAEAFQADPRAQVVAIAGHTPEKTTAVAATFNLEIAPTWLDLVQRSDVELVVVCTVNRDHGPIVQAALAAGKHVVVEYPLALNVAEAEALIAQAQGSKRLLHVEHIELLSGIHQTIRQHLPQVGIPFYVRSATINPQRPVGDRWTYRPDLFGFPLIAALARLSRLIDLFGAVANVTCQTRYWSHNRQCYSQWPDPTVAYAACVCNAQLQFASGLLADLSYGKGETFWHPSRVFEVQGDQAALIMDGDDGKLVQADGVTVLATSSRRGLFARDTTLVLDYLLEGKPLYTSAVASLYALRVAAATQRAADSGQLTGVQ
ncbi:MAG: Gfo/Idh/MocA family oxidoreductase [Cyanobacteria bacterium]|nr:Gfo/Idh/MocA family oxidoreductase [Cyanobacteriota bacterium]MDW8201579.1 Gfo/Idh/MocA family oxidoreductase [Cyanobacteriota bacterium SKYGB_h_bin112]